MTEMIAALAGAVCLIVLSAIALGVVLAAVTGRAVRESREIDRLFDAGGP